MLITILIKDNMTFSFCQMTFPFDWQPKIVSTQLVLLGSLAIAAVPGEFTTMSGRRMKRLLSQKLEAAGLENPTVIVAGLCNTYSDYITTFEEYQVRRKRSKFLIRAII